jgi:cell division protein FtsW
LQREVEQREAELFGEETPERASRRAEKIARYERRKKIEAERRERLEKRRAACPACHWGLSLLTALLILISLPIIYSASMPVALADGHAPDFYFLRQAIFAAVGYAAFLGISRMRPPQMRVFVWVLYGITLVGLAAIAFTPFGFTQSGVKRWLKIPGVPPQQLSEFAKIAVIGVMADFWSRAARSAQRSYWPWVAAAGFTLPIAGLVLIQPHLSAALLLCALPLAMAWFADVPMKRIGVLVTPLVLLGAVTVFLCMNHAMPGLKPYQQERIAAHFGGEADAQGSNYQKLQSERTLVSGGLLGRGPGESLGKQGHLPEPHTDFVFAVIGEEYGLAGTLALLVCYGLLIFFCFQIGHVAETMFEALLCAGVGTLMAIQVVCNMGVATGILPVTGMPLPFMSYGGSGLVCVLCGLGLVLAVSRGMSRNCAERTEETRSEFDRTSVAALA